MMSSPIWKLRADILKRDGRLCHVCGLVMRWEVKQKKNEDYRWVGLNMTIDHVVPTSEGGLTVIENLKLAHRYCNGARSTKSMDEIREAVSALLADWEEWKTAGCPPRFIHKHDGGIEDA